MKKMMSELSSYKSQRLLGEQCDIHEGRNDSCKAEVHEAARKDIWFKGQLEHLKRSFALKPWLQYLQNK